MGNVEEELINGECRGRTDCHLVHQTGDPGPGVVFKSLQAGFKFAVERNNVVPVSIEITAEPGQHLVVLLVLLVPFLEGIL